MGSLVSCGGGATIVFIKVLEICFRFFVWVVLDGFFLFCYLLRVIERWSAVVYWIQGMTFNYSQDSFSDSGYIYSLSYYFYQETLI